MFEQPDSSSYTIYSKSNCLYCTKAKQLLKDETFHIIDCDQYLSERKLEFMEFISKFTKQNTFPFIFYNGGFIGGYNELLNHLTFMEDF